MQLHLTPGSTASAIVGRAFEGTVDPSVLRVLVALDALKRAIDEVPERIAGGADQDLYSLSYALIRGEEVFEAMGDISSCEAGCAHHSLPYFGKGRIEQPALASVA